MSRTYHELIAAIDHFRTQLTAWQETGLVTPTQRERITDVYNKWAAELVPDVDYTSVLPPARLCAPEHQVLETERRNLVFAEQEVRRQASQERLTMVQAQSLVADVRRKLAEVEKTLNYTAAPVEGTPPSEAPPGRSLMEYLLDPRSLQALMITGGALLMLGLVIWLWSVGVFENPIVVACSMAAVNLGVLAGGAALVRYTRYQTAGRAMTLLACLALPLNLWFYDAQDLISIRKGEPLWVPALVCCAIYAGIARLLKDAKFVYALVAGVAMTGLLFLADDAVDRFWSVLGPSTFLVLLGAICIHVERLFHTGEGPFNRANFGRAFFIAGHVAMGAGLAVLLGGRLVGDFYETVFAQYLEHAPKVSTVIGSKLTALLLALLGTYTYAYSQIVVSPTSRRYAWSSVLALVWSEVILLDLLNVPATESLWLIVMASTGLLAYIATSFWSRTTEEVDPMGTALGSVGALCTAIASLWGTVALVRGLLVPVSSEAGFLLDPLYAIAMTMTAGAAMMAARVARQRGLGDHAKVWMQAAAIPAMAVVATGATMAGVESLALLLPILLLVPIAMEVAGRFGRGDGPLADLSYAGYAATMFLLTVSIAAVTGITGEVMVADNYTLAAFYAAAAGLLMAGSLRQKTLLPAVAAGLSGCAAVWQLLTAVGLAEYSAIVAASVVGLGVMAIGRRKQEADQPTHLLTTLGASLVTLGAGGGLLMTLGRVLGDNAEWGLVTLAAGQAIAAVIASVLTKSKDWKTTSRTLAGLHVLAGVLVANMMLGLSMWERGELILVAAGTLLLAAGHIRWKREGEIRDPAVDLHIFAGSLLVAIPLTIGMLAQRIGDYHPVWTVVPNEVGALLAGLALLGAGVVCRMRATTFVGATVTTVWVLSLVTLVNLQLQNASVYMMIGGGAFFAVAVMLSIYRDRLLALPEKVRNREGLFGVLDWR
ncbi:hypothetical protein [Aeoliella sp. SH292]|uniref:hypothetical protein n=1 Tax=Aeoliella sp. SH292 TaxID=3454464 RepID=UPI003F9B9CAC